MKWIDVDDKLPDTGKEVLVCCEMRPTESIIYHSVRIASIITILDHYGEIEVTWRGENYSELRPSFWMLLPDPPKF